MGMFTAPLIRTAESALTEWDISFQRCVALPALLQHGDVEQWVPDR